MEDILYLDFETRSKIDLKKSNAYNYSEHFSTEVMCMGWALNEAPIEIWEGWEAAEVLPKKEFPIEIKNHIASGKKVVSHNIPFEYLIYLNVLRKKLKALPDFRLENGICTMAASFSASLPGALEAVAPTLGLEIQKDMIGHKCMLFFSTPKKEGNFATKEEYPEKWQAMLNYCKKDVEVGREIFKRVPKLSKEEQKVWLLDQKINARGVFIDKAAVEKAYEIVELEKKKLNTRIQELTKGEVATCKSTAQLMEWLKRQKIDTESVDKLHIENLLENKNISLLIKEVLKVKKKGSKSSNAKLLKMLEKANDKNRIKGGLQFHVATTGRWGAWGLQLHNLPKRLCGQEEVDCFFEVLEGPSKNLMDKIDLFFGDINSIISSSLRGFIKAPSGKKLIVCDFAAIEARVLAWLAGEENILKAFRTHGKIYEKAAAGIYNIDFEKVTEKQRAVGKTAILALGYQGGLGAFRKLETSLGLNLNLSDEEVEEIKQKWRYTNPKIVSFWNKCNDAASKAIRNPGKIFKAEKIAYTKKGSFLWCRLPSGRTIKYPYPTLKTKETPWGTLVEEIRFKGINAVTRKWESQSTYGGKLVENVTQAVARCLLVSAMEKVEAASYPIIFHVHDEIVCEVNENFGSSEEIEKLMCINPVWAKDLPLKAEGFETLRYRK